MEICKVLLCNRLLFLLIFFLSFMAAPILNINRWWSKETVAVVTGSNKGIGYAIAKQLARHDLTVVLTARDVDRGQKAADLLRAHNLPVEFHQLDILDSSSILAFALWLRGKFGGLDILVNNAGVSFNKVDKNSVDHAEITINTNFHGTKSLIETLLPLFRRSPATSRILNLSSQLGLLNKVRNPSLKATLEDDKTLTVEKIEAIVSRFLVEVRDGSWPRGGWPEIWTDYAVSKLALNYYSNLLAKEHNGCGISINCYCPGFTRTDMTQGDGSHSADESAELAVKLVLASPLELQTGKFIKWSRKPALPSKL